MTAGRPPELKSDLTVTQSSNATVPLVAVASVRTSGDFRRVLIRAVADDHTREQTVETSGHHLEVPFWGLRAGRTYSVRLGLEGEGEGEVVWSDPVDYTTPELSADLPPLTLLASEPAAMEPGVILFSATRYNDDESQTDDELTLLVVVDAEGEIVWYYLDSAGSVDDARQLANGNFLFNRSVLEIVEMSPAGDIVTTWKATGKIPAVGHGLVRLDVDSFHHEVFAIDDDHFITLATSLVEAPDFPTSETDPDAPTETADIIADVIVEFDREGTIRSQIHLADLLDTSRIGYDSLTQFWNALYPEAENGTRDWSHANAVVYDSRDDTILVSLRHQDAMLKLRRDSGEILWILGVNEDWGDLADRVLRPVGDTSPQFHQHAPEITDAGTIFVHDNGNYRARPYEDQLPPSENSSRALELRVDEAAGTYEQVWVFEGDSSDSFLAAFVGDVDRMPTTGNVLVTQGGISENDGEAWYDALSGHHRAAIWEVTHERDPRVLFHLQVGSKDASATGWYVYRSEKLTAW